jgi:aryl-alcohol dehydrogenase-like predicted oxidoreductase
MLYNQGKINPLFRRIAMQTRLFGRTGHASTLAIFGAAAFWDISQPDADRVVEQVLRAGVNHFDVAPSYGMAEERLGPWMGRIREQIFLGCKTMERSASGAEVEMRRSLKRLQVDHFDLYQLHAVTRMDELDEVTRTGGALEAVIKAREAGLTHHIGITGHGYDAPRIYLEALRRFDFDSVLFPVNFVQYADPVYREHAEALLQECRKRSVGVMAIKSVCRGPWESESHTYTTWYRPFDEPRIMQRSVDFALSQDISGICTAGDTRILPMVLQACEAFAPLNLAEQQALVAEADQYAPLFTPAG